MLILSRNYNNEVAVHRNVQIIWVYLSETPRYGAAGAQHCPRATTLHPTTFKKRIGQYLLQEINIKVQNKEILMIWGSKNDFRAWR